MLINSGHGSINNINQSQDLIADAELKSLVPARNQLAFHPVVANNILGAEKAITDETYCTNTETDTIEHYIDTDSHQGLKLQPGRQLMNSNPFLSDLDSLELINDIDSFNKVSIFRKIFISFKRAKRAK